MLTQLTSGLYRRRTGIEDAYKQDKYPDTDFERKSYLDTILVNMSFALIKCLFALDTICIRGILFLYAVKMLNLKTFTYKIWQNQLSLENRYDLGNIK